jgi:hypothetical protein
MKINFFSCLFLTSLFVATAVAAEPEPAQVVERGPNHRLLQRVSRVVLRDGRVVNQTNSYTEIGGGICYFRDGQWRDSKAQFQLLPGGAIAQEGPMQLILTPDIVEEGSVDLLIEGGKRFRSSPRWLVYHDLATGQSAIIAAVKSCVGQLVEPNVIVYPDAFDAVRAALKYEYHSMGHGSVGGSVGVWFAATRGLRPESQQPHRPGNVVRIS